MIRRRPVSPTLVTLCLLFLSVWPSVGRPQAATAEAEEPAGVGLLEGIAAELVPSAPPERWLALRRTAPGGLPKTASAPPEKTRGGPDWPGVYRGVAPSVLFLTSGGGFGTGFLIDDRSVLTNHHVARMAMATEERHLALNAYTGSLSPEGAMSPSQEAIRAEVLKWDPARDLALLRLEKSVRGVRPLEIPVASGPGPGQEVALIGNAGLGLLWSMKPGHVAAIGTVRENLPWLLAALDSELRGSGAASSASAEDLEAMRAAMEEGLAGWIGGETLLIQATATSSSGDSGGPLVDADGKVVGICFGGRTEGAEGTEGSYFYIHRREIVDFLADRPREPLLALAYDFWSTDAVRHGFAPYFRAVPPALTGVDPSGQPTFVAADLDADTEPGEVASMVARKAYDAEVAVVIDHPTGTVFAIYDLDNDGAFEIQRLDTRGDGLLDELYVRQGDRYVPRRITGGSRLFLSPGEVPAAWRAAYAALLDAL